MEDIDHLFLYCPFTPIAGGSFKIFGIKGCFIEPYLVQSFMVLSLGIKQAYYRGMHPRLFVGKLVWKFSRGLRG